jgi:putative transposase
MADSFFATLEVELIDRSAWADPTEARAAVCEYIEVFYNCIRRRGGIGYLSPDQTPAKTRGLD